MGDMRLTLTLAAGLGRASGGLTGRERGAASDIERVCQRSRLVLTIRSRRSRRTGSLAVAGEIPGRYAVSWFPSRLVHLPGIARRGLGTLLTNWTNYSSFSRRSRGPGMSFDLFRGVLISSAEISFTSDR